MAEQIVLYLSYGEGPHVAEIIFSALSAVHLRRPGDKFEIVISTDNPAPFAGLPLTVDLVPPEQMTAWGGSAGFGHRRKILAFGSALKKFNAPVLMADGDTYFRRSPGEAFARIAPGRSLMHVREGELGYLAAHGYMRERLSGLAIKIPAGETYDLPKEAVVYNAGVIGLHPADGKLVDTVLELTDGIHEASPSWLSEQVAFSQVLARHTKLAGCRDLVFHYHEKVMRAPFRQVLPGLLRQFGPPVTPEKCAALYAHRPTPPLGKKAKALLKRPLKRLGFFRHDLQTSI